MLDHVSIGVKDPEKSKELYSAMLAPLGLRLLVEEGIYNGYGEKYPEFWVQTPYDGNPADAGNGFHVCFRAASRADVDAFHAAALEAGATDDGAPGPRPEYSSKYYGGFVRDFDGNKIEAVCYGE